LKNKVEELSIAYENASLQAKIVEDLRFDFDFSHILLLLTDLSFRSKLQVATTELETLKAREAVTVTVKSDTSDQTAELEGKITALSEQLGAKAASVASLESSLKESQAKLDSTNVLLSNANIESTKLRTKLAEVEKKLSEVEKKLVEVRCL